VLGTNFVNISLIALADGVFAGGPVVDTLGRFEALSALLGVLPTGVFSGLLVLLVFAAGVTVLFSAAAPL
jgi:hypothetical protein